MEHEQVEEILALNSPGSLLSAPCMAIPEGDHAVPALQDVLLPDDSPVQISSEVDQGLFAIAGFLAVDHPLFGAITGNRQVVVDHGLEEPCPEDLGQSLVTEEISRRFYLPETLFQIDARPGHDHMDVGMIVKGSGMGMENGGETWGSAEFLVVFGKRFQDFLYCGEHQGIDCALISPRQVTELLRDGKGDQVVLAWQTLADLVFYPLLTFVLLTMRAVSVAAGVGNVALFATMLI